MNKDQAQITLEQLGGTGLLKLMIGAKDFTFDSTGETGLRFKFELSDFANMVDISLRNDLYTMKFYKIEPMLKKDADGNLELNPDANFDPQPVAVFEGVENNMLAEIFEDFTKLTIKPVRLVAA